MTSLVGCKFDPRFDHTHKDGGRHELSLTAQCLHDREGRTDKSADTWTSCMNAAMHMMDASLAC